MPCDWTAHLMVVSTFNFGQAKSSCDACTAYKLSSIAENWRYRQTASLRSVKGVTVVHRAEDILLTEALPPTGKVIASQVALQDSLWILEASQQCEPLRRWILPPISHFRSENFDIEQACLSPGSGPRPGKAAVLYPPIRFQHRRPVWLNRERGAT